MLSLALHRWHLSRGSAVKREVSRLEFRPAAEIHGQAVTILARERERLTRLVPPGQLSLTGGSSVPAALTRGDVDLHLRVPSADFASVVELLGTLYRPVLLEIWTATLATFEVDARLPTGIAVTPIGSEHDTLFARTWGLLSTDAALLEAYNELKRRHDGGEIGPYLEAKSAFFAALVAPRDEDA